MWGLIFNKQQFLEAIADWVRTGFPRSISFLFKRIPIIFELLEAGTILINKYLINRLIDFLIDRAANHKWQYILRKNLIIFYDNFLEKVKNVGWKILN